MRRFTEPGILARLLFLLVVLALIGIAPRPHAVTQAFQQARLALQGSGSPQAAARAAQALGQVAAQIPWEKGLWEKAGRLALKGGDNQAAIQFLERAAAADDLSQGGEVALGDAYAASGDRPAAVRHWEAVLQAGGSLPGTFQVEVLTRLLESHHALGDFSAAISDLQSLTSLRPSDAGLRYQLGLFMATQRPEAALAHLVQAAELDPSLDEKTQGLIRAIRTASLKGDPAQTLFEAGRALASSGEWELASEAFRQATQDRPDFADAWAFWGEARQHLPVTSSSQAVPLELEKALSLDPTSLSANTLMALYWQRQRRFDRALEYLHRVTGLYPENPALQVELGEVLALSGDLQGGLQAYQAAVKLAPQDALYYRLLASFCIRHESYVHDVGLPAARQAVILDGENPDNLDTLGQALFLEGDLGNAERNYQRAIELQPEHAPAHLHLGLVYMLQGERDLARQEWEQVASLAPGSPEADQAERLVKNYFP